MNIKSLYLRYKFWLNDFFKGSLIAKPYREIKYIMENSFEKGLPIREKYLHNLLDYYRQNSKYYSKYEGYDLSKYPVQTKLTLISNGDSMSVLENVIPGQIGTVFVQRTSGSTGNPLAIPQDTRKRLRRIAEIKYFGKQLGFNSHEKLIHLRIWNQWQQKSIKQIRCENIVPFDVKRIGENDLKELCELIIKEKAISIRGYASCFDRISKVSQKCHYNFPSLRILISTSEALEDEVRANVKQYMKCEIASQYANEECGILAQEKVPTLPLNNKMYFNWAGYFIETLKIHSDAPAEYGEICRIVLTDLHNYAFPIIRYDTGDTCILLPPDEYSNGYPVIGKLYGRRFDLTYGNDGTPIYPLAYGRVLKNYDCIISWQFIQEGEKEYDLRLVLKSKDEKTLTEIKNNMVEILGFDAILKISIVNENPVLQSGKRKPVINKWGKMND